MITLGISQLLFLINSLLYIKKTIKMLKIRYSKLYIIYTNNKA